MLANPLPLPVVMDDNFLMENGVPLDGNPDQRRTVMAVVETMVMAYLKALIVDSGALVPPVYITEVLPILYPWKQGRPFIRTSWGPITSVTSIDLLDETETPVSSLQPSDYTVSSEVRNIIYLPWSVFTGDVRVVYTAGYPEASANPNLRLALKKLYELYSSTLIVNRGMSADEQVIAFNNKAYALSLKSVASSPFGQHQDAATVVRLLDNSGLRIMHGGVYAVWI